MATRITLRRFSSAKKTSNRCLGFPIYWPRWMTFRRCPPRLPTVLPEAVHNNILAVIDSYAVAKCASGRARMPPQCVDCVKFSTMFIRSIPRRTNGKTGCQRIAQLRTGRQEKLSFGASLVPDLPHSGQQTSDILVYLSCFFNPKLRAQLHHSSFVAK